MFCQRTDTLATHTFFVIYYAMALATLLKWEGPMEVLCRAALVHDLDEIVTGDIVAPVKHRLVDPDKVKALVQEKMSQQMPWVADLMDWRGGSWSKDIGAIVKAADSLDALFFVCTETCLGNAILKSRQGSCLDRLKEAWAALPATKRGRDKIWRNFVSPAIKDHERPSSYDIV